MLALHQGDSNLVPKFWAKEQSCTLGWARSLAFGGAMAFAFHRMCRGRKRFSAETAPLDAWPFRGLVSGSSRSRRTRRRPAGESGAPSYP